MSIWKWFGWNNKEARIKMNESDNWHLVNCKEVAYE